MKEGAVLLYREVNYYSIAIFAPSPPMTFKTISEKDFYFDRKGVNDALKKQKKKEIFSFFNMFFNLFLASPPKQ